MKRLFGALSILLLAACSLPTIQEPPAEPLPEDTMEATSSDMMQEIEEEEGTEETMDEDEGMLEDEDAGETEEEEGTVEGTVEEPRVITVNVDNWSFAPAAITAKKGEIVELHLVGVSGAHSFSVPALGINVPISAGETKTLSLPTSEDGAFEFLCSIPCGSGHRDMRGTLIIQP